MILHTKNMSPSACYFAMVQTIIPRPIAWVLSENSPNNFNLAPFSFFTGVCSDPPIVMISVGKKAEGAEAGMEKDTRRNIRERKHFVLHIPDCNQLSDVNLSAKTLDFGVSEVDEQSLPLTDFEGFSLPRLRDSKIALGCSLYQLDEIGHQRQAVIYGEVKQIFLDDNIATVNESGRLTVDPKKVDPISRLGGSYYSNLGELLTANRPA